MTLPGKKAHVDKSGLRRRTMTHSVAATEPNRLDSNLSSNIFLAAVVPKQDHTSFAYYWLCLEGLKDAATSSPSNLVQKRPSADEEKTQDELRIKTALQEILVD